MLRYRIAELLKQKGLNFDEVYLNPTSDTESYKIKVMLKILQKHPHIDTVQIWEDHPGHLPKFVKAIEATGRTCIPHLIKSTKHEVECTQEDMEKMVAEGWSKWRNAMKDFKTKDFLKEMQRSIGGDIHRDTLDVWNEKAEQGLIISAEMAPNGVMVSVEIEDYRERQIGRFAIPWDGNMKRFVKDVLNEAKVKRIRLASSRVRLAIDIRKPPQSLKLKEEVYFLPHPFHQENAHIRAKENLSKYRDSEKFYDMEIERGTKIKLLNRDIFQMSRRKWLVLAWAQVAKEVGLSSKLDPSVKAFVRQHSKDRWATKVAVLHLAKDSKAQEYVKEKAEELKEKGYEDDKAFAVAWSIYCKYKSKEIPDSEGHCQKSPSEYFPNKKKKASPSDVGNRWFSRLGKTAGNIPSKAPREVKQVAKAWEENAMKAAETNIAEDGETGSEARSTMKFWKDRLYVSEMRSDKGPRWLISDNYERASTMVYYPDSDEWYYMPLYGSESLMRGGTREALANAKIFWTGYSGSIRLLKGIRRNQL